MSSLDKDKVRSTVAVAEELIYLDRPGGRLPVYGFFPDDGKEHPAIILIHEIFGVNAHIQDLGRRFAEQSFAVYAPDLFAYSSRLPDNKNDLNAMRAVWQAASDEQYISDLQAVFSLCRSAERVTANAIGTIGYCMGGAMAFMFACRTPLLAWVVDYYGRIIYSEVSELKPRHPLDYAAGLNCPFLGLYAGIDDLIPQAHIQALQDKLSGYGKDFKIKVYPKARHAFFNDQRPFYDQESAQDSWLLTLDFMRENGCKS